MNLSKLLLCSHCLTLFGVVTIFLVKFGNDKLCHTIRISHPLTSDLRQKTLFYGKWMKGQTQLEQTCDFMNKTKCCKEKQDLHFIFNKAELNNINAVDEMKQILRNKTILFIGDSMTREFFNGIRELLRIKEGTRNDTINFLITLTIYIKKSSPVLDIPTSVTEETLAREISKYDVIVLNQGLHYIIGPLEQVAMHFYYIGKLLRELTYNTTKQVIIRSTTPQYFVTPSGTGFFSEWSQTEVRRCLRRVPHPTLHPTNHFLLDIARKYNFKFLDNFPIYYERGDLTFVFNKDGVLDCTHHCYTPETIWPELVLLTQLIK